MGYLISVQGESFDFGEWRNSLDGVQLELSPFGMQVAEMFAEESDDEVWLHRRGGMRGVTVRRDGDGAEISLPAGVSEVDFLLAGTLVRSALAHGAVARDEEGRELTGLEEEMSALGMECRRFFWSGIWHDLDQGPTTLPVGGMLHFTIAPEDRADGTWIGFEQTQLARMSRYETALIAARMRYQGGSREGIVSNYHHGPTLLASDVEWVVMNGASGDLTDGNPVSMAAFLEIFADRVEDLGPWIYVPPIDFVAEGHLAARLRAAAGCAGAATLPIPTVIAQTQSQADAGGASLSGEDWMLLAKMAVFCTYLVASADGSVDRKELSTIQRLLQDHRSCPYPVLSKVLGIAYASLEHVADQLQEEDLPPLVHFARLQGVLRKFPDEEAGQIREGFLAIAKAVAESSSGLFGFGPKISKKEQAVLEFLRTAL